MKNKKLRSAFSLIELSIVILIIGILVAGVTQGSRLISQFRLSSARAITQSSPVTSIKDLTIWLESTSEQSFDDAQTEDGTRITNWYDLNTQISQKSNAAPVSVGPTYKANCINGLPCLQFNGSSEFLNITQTQGAVSDASIFLVINNLVLPTGLNNQSVISAYNATGAATSNLRVYTYLGGTGGLGFTHGSVGGGYGSSLTVNNNTIVNAIERSGSEIIAFSVLNGVFDIRSSSSSYTAKTLNSGISIGAHYNGTAGSEFFNGYIAEVIVFSRGLKASEAADVNAYLSKKWAIKI
jgi:prepilin-type N-terminal cleavage/methylation domain-containing protein